MSTHEQLELSLTGAASVKSAISRTSESAIGRRVFAVFAFALLTAIAARIAVPIAVLPVPLTLQVVAVLLSGYLLGPRLGFASQITYLAIGAIGFPVFAAGGGAAYLLGPTGGTWRPSRSRRPWRGWATAATGGCPFVPSCSPSESQ